MSSWMARASRRGDDGLKPLQYRDMDSRPYPGTARHALPSYLNRIRLRLQSSSRCIGVAYPPEHWKVFEVACPQIGIGSFDGRGNDEVDRIDAGMGTKVLVSHLSGKISDCLVDRDPVEQGEKSLCRSLFTASHACQHLNLRHDRGNQPLVRFQGTDQSISCSNIAAQMVDQNRGIDDNRHRLSRRAIPGRSLST